MKTKKRQLRSTWSISLLWGIVVICCIMYARLQKARLDREWSLDQALMPQISIDNNMVNIKNIRDVQYQTKDDYIVTYYDQSFDLTQLNEIWYTVEPFGMFNGPAQTLLTFGFNGQYISISVEARRQRNERYNPVYGVINGYELMYIIASEKDVLGLRTNYRKDDVYLYPIRTTQTNMKLLFVDMVTRAQLLSEHPEFYNTIANNSMVNIRKHVNKLRTDKIPFQKALVLPHDSDRIAYNLGLIDSILPFNETKQLYHINDIATQCPEDTFFSQCIRNGLRDRMKTQ